jgi:fibronectin type 3 domain-containing protein
MKRIFAALSVLGLGLAAPLAVCQAKVTTCEVNLAWDAPASSPDPVAGYNAYRAQSGSTNYTLLNSAPLALTPTVYTDLGSGCGVTQNYIVESVDALGVTSAPSNVASIALPAMPPAMAKPSVKFNP